ncbi:alpha/beta fold hydrolase [Pinibacter soli]|uniref:Alpha/beta hydrolase n=1 Tax=Pinibacter soli TaxID=3044211 RepID=A0ABT6RGJ8_9BACT|nr:alpha/beta hydrolase [Pinibacter soli]MDI3321699.1 alpha/beta hydrolase [Pinibacter soli]
MKAYFISGLGADKRAFKYIKVPDKYQAVHIDWIQPVKQENIQAYTKRLSSAIDDSEPFILIGLSFGGIIACELAKITRPQKVIIISSVTTHTEIPYVYRLAGKYNLDKYLPYNYMLKATPALFWLFGPLTNEARVLLGNIIRETDHRFFTWAISQIVRWKNDTKPENLLQLHGKKDKIFWNSHAHCYIDGGGHFMVYTHGEIINSLLTELQ